jgi:hypothetical protein
MKGSSSSFTGAMGISPNRYNNLTDEEPLPTFFESLRSSTRIAGRSWAYTAGAVNSKPARVKNQSLEALIKLTGNIFGSLILGGYDAGRIDESKSKLLSLKMMNDPLRELSVGLQGISISEGSKTDATTQILKKPVSLPIEPLISRIWLPQAVCDEFEQVLGLNWNESAQLYFITDEQHTSLLARNISITFSLSDASLKGPTTDISFAYADLALQAIHPLTDHPGRYFPIQRSYIDNQIVLGRAFLQATYVIADYDRMTMNISQASLDANSEKRIYTIMPPLSPSTSSEVQPGAPNAPTTRNMSPGAVAGIVVGCVLGVLALVIGSITAAYLLRKNSGKPARGVELDGETQHTRRAELETKGFTEKWEMDGSVEPVELSPISVYRELEGDMAPVELDATEHGMNGAVDMMAKENLRGS